jgi:dimethylhistidine N-methyltransferase
MAALLQPAPALSQFALDVREGLTRSGQKTLPCTYFYDDVGTALFQAICQLPEYGLMRADDRILANHAVDLAQRMPERVTVVELGSGDGIKTRRVLQALDAAADDRRPVVYYPIDVSRAALDACRLSLNGFAQVRPVQASYLQGLQQVDSLRKPGDHILVLFLGSTIGNFDRAEALQFLTRVRSFLRAGDALLLGADLVKPEPRLLAAYDDPAGITAAFNRNLLARINRELGADFALHNFAHEARYDRAAQRVEMHLRSLIRQNVRIPDAGIVARFQRGETIWTESSHKFKAPELIDLGTKSGFECAVQWQDAEWPFCESLFIARGGEGADSASC